MRRQAALVAARAVARLVARTPARRLLHSRLAARARFAAGREMTASAVVEVASCLEEAGLAHWLCGGWGVDALVGRQTRRHGDLDVVVDGSDRRLPTAADAALARLGLERVATETSIEPMPTIWVYSDGHGRTVDLLPVDVVRPPFDRDDAWARGRIGQTEVGCISVTLQRTLRAGYPTRKSDRDDLAALDALAAS